MAEKVKIQLPSGSLYNAATQVVKHLRDAGYKSYWVGGAVRDMLLQRMPGDVDIVTSARPEQVKTLWQDAEMVGACFGVVLVRHDGMVFEIATCREERTYLDGRRPEEVRFTDNFELDVFRRDFTVNAMLYDPLDEVVLDYACGLQDLQRRVIRVVGKAEERFAEDYLRMLRAVRFAAKLDFALEANTRKAIQNMADLVGKLAPERVRGELEQMICSARPAAALRLLMECGLLKFWLKEVADLSGVEQHPVYHPEGDVWQHTLLMFENLNSVPSAGLAWSILLHDIGKKPTFKRDAENIPRFYGHEAVGADMVPVIAERLRFSRELADCVEHAVRNHMRFASVMAMRPAKLKRLLAEKDFAMELELHRVDCLSSNGLMETYEFLSEQLRRQPQKALPEALVNGNDLIKLGLKPGKRFKQILDAVMDAQLENRFADKTAALEFVEREYCRNPDSGSEQ